MIYKILCFFGLHDWKHYKDSLTMQPVRCCMDCDKKQTGVRQPTYDNRTKIIWSNLK